MLKKLIAIMVVGAIMALAGAQGVEAGFKGGPGNDVTTLPPEVLPFVVLGASTLEQVAPGAVSYVEGTDFNVMTESEPGDVTASVTAVDLQLGLGNTSNSGCEAADFAGFPAGNIALLQRGTCTFQQKAENAAAVGAVGAIIFNSGVVDSESFMGLIPATLSPEYGGGIPVLFATYDRGVEWAGTPGLVMHMVANVSRETLVTPQLQLIGLQTPAPGQTAPGGIYQITATFRNNGNALEDLFFRTVTLAYSNGAEPHPELANRRAGTPPQAGSELDVALPGGALNTGDTIEVTFDIMVPRVAQFTFFVDAFTVLGP